tara:strand:+ start:339 stop:782 length:444 start_codon:yes stop_codon:yes gene_type:complete
MHVNFLRTGVGVESVSHLHEIQSTYRQLKQSGQTCAFLTTRRTPTRANDMVNGGSVYWIIKRQICARQEIIDVQTLEDDEGKAYCRIVMSPAIMLTSPLSHRHIQGWRYLTPEKAPQDLRPFDPTDKNNNVEIDPKMAEELAELGLL